MMARVALLFLLVAGCGQRYRVNEAALNVPNVFLHEVRVSGDETTLVFRLEADEACAIGVPPPGDARAFRLRAGERTIPLTGVSGVAELPGTTAIDARGSERFALTFGALPEDVRQFRVEGEIEGAGPVAFAVGLDAPSVVKRGW